MSKKVYLDNSGREGLFRGINLLAKTVGSTLGPTGKTVIIKNGMDKPFATKDGVTAAKCMDSDDHLENVGIQMIKDTSIKMDEKAGDGTTGATVLCASMIEIGFNDYSEISDIVSYKHGMETAVDEIVDFIKKNSMPATSKVIENVAIISANNDIALGKLVAKAVKAAGEFGRINIIESLRLESSFDKFEGFSVDLGFADQVFSNNPKTGYFHSKSAKLLLHKSKITDKEEFLMFMDRASKLQKDLVIIAQDYSSEIINLARFANSNINWGYKICLVKNPMRENEFEAIYKDLEIYTGAQSVNKFKGYIEDLGDLHDIVIKPGYSIFGRTEEDCSEYVEELKQDLSNEQIPNKQEILRKRICQFTDGYINFYVGGYTEVEAKERYDRVQDAVNACRAAKEDGVIIGGGQLLYKFSLTKEISDIDNSYVRGKENVYDAIRSITRQIYDNSIKSFDFSDIQDILSKDLKSGKKLNHGWDFKNNFEGNLFTMGVVDPVKVVANSLYSAVSVAGTILTTECVIVEVS